MLKLSPQFRVEPIVESVTRSDSFSLVFHNQQVWKIGGFEHWLMDTPDYDENCGYNTDYKYAHVSEYADAMPLTGNNASSFWEFYAYLKIPVAMTCVLSVDKYIYVIGGYNEHQRELDTVQYFDDTSMQKWAVKNEKLVDPIFAHGCAKTSLPDGRHVILTVGGFKYENVPTVRKMYFVFQL